MAERESSRFQKRTRSGVAPRSLDLVAQANPSYSEDKSQTLIMPTRQFRLQASEHKKVILGHGANSRVCHYGLKKGLTNQSYTVSQNGVQQLDQLDVSREDKGTKIVNIRLDMASPSLKNSSKARNRFMSRQKNLKDVALTSSGPERRTLMDYIRDKQDSFLDKDPHNKLSRIGSLRKQEDEFIDYINRKLLHIQKLRPALRVRNKQSEQKRLPGQGDIKLLPTLQMVQYNSALAVPLSQPISYQHTEKERLCRHTKENGSRKLDCEVFSEYTPSKRGCSGRKQFFVFGMSDRPQQSLNRIEMYRDFLWKINFTNGLFIEPNAENEGAYKVYIGKGNNSMLLRGLMKRRFWWTVVDKPTEDVQFAWSQIKDTTYLSFQKQPRSLRSQVNSLSSQSLRSELLSERSVTPVEATRRVRGKRSRNLSTDSDGQRKAQSTKVSQMETSELKDPHTKIFSQVQMALWARHMERHGKVESSIDDKTYVRRSWLLKFKEAIRVESSESLHVSNHFVSNTFIGNKKAMFYTMRKYYQLKRKDVFQVLPVTFHISKGIDDPEYQRFLDIYKVFEEEKLKDKNVRNIWIAKPGEFTNRGTGISVCASLDDIKLRLRGRERNANGTLRTFILQKYIEKPLLYNKRKFDIRHYMLMTCTNGMFKGYWYQEGYLRTSSYEFSTKNYRDPQIHLTNDAIQKHNDSYGKYEKGNKLSYSDFQKYLDVAHKGRNLDFFNVLLPKMRDIAANAIRASYFLLDPQRRSHNFEIFGLDFMIDEDFTPWLIEVNTNPCLELGCPLLARLIPNMVENALKISVDPLFPPPYTWQMGRKYQLGDEPLQSNSFQLIFDQGVEGEAIQQLFKNVDKIDRNMGEIEEQDQEFEEETAKEWDGQL